jgi:RNA polymerase sigma factor (sigma-70 family)
MEEQNAGSYGEGISLGIFLRDIKNIQLLTREEEYVLARRARQGDPESVRRLIEANLRFVIKVALRYRYWNPGLPLMDMISEGCLGLMEAIETFNLDLGYRLITYAELRIRWRIIRVIRDHRKHELISLDEPIYNDGEETAKDLLVSEDLWADEKYFQSQVEYMIRNVFDCLNDRERKVIRLRFWDGFTLENAGLKIGSGKERTRQIEAKALRKLRGAFRKKNLEASAFF